MNEESPPFPMGNPEKCQALDTWIQEHIARREKLAGGPAHWELFMHYIDKMGWSEHGGGINSSWLTAEGKAALSTLNELRLE
jgi:hypothetical protein